MKKLIFLFSILNVLIFNIVNAADIDLEQELADFDMNDRYGNKSIEGIDMEEVEGDKNEHLYYAVLKNNMPLFSDLINAKADPLKYTEIFTADTRCPLSEIIRLGRDKMLETLLIDDKYINSKEARKAGINMRVAALHWAIFYEKIDKAKDLARDITTGEIRDLDRYGIMLQFLIEDCNTIDYDFEGEGLKYFAKEHKKSEDLIKELIKRVQKSLKSDAGDQKS